MLFLSPFHQGRASPLCCALLVSLLAARPARGEFVISGFIGDSKTQSAPLTIVQPEIGTRVRLHEVPYSGEAFTPPLYYGTRIAWFSRETSRFGVEAEFIHLKAYADTAVRTRVSGTRGGAALDATVPIASIVQRFSISHGLNLLLVNVVGRRVLSTGRVTLAGRLGIGPTIPHAESVVEGITHEGYELGALAVHGGAGIELRVVRSLALLAEYKFTRTRQSVEIDRGKAEGLFASHHALVGVGWRISRQ